MEEQKMKSLTLDEAKTDIARWKFIADKTPRYGDEELCEGRSQAYGNCLDLLARVEIPSQEWQPIDELPEEWKAGGECFSGYDPELMSSTLSGTMQFNGAEFVLVNFGQAFNTPCNPTRWRPLPKPPKTA